MIKVERSGARVDVILSAPERRNAQTEETWIELARIGRDLDPRTRVVVLRAEGESFSAGLDKRVFTGEANPNLQEMLQGTNEEMQDRIAVFQEAFRWWQESDAITIAQVQGHAIGAGFQLALACDQRIIADNASFAMKEISLGLVSDLTGTYSLMQLVGYSRALDISTTGRFVEAAEAVHIGLALQSVPAEDLAAAVDSYVESLMAMQEPALRAVKRLFNQVRTRDKQFVAERREQTALLRGMLGD